MSEIQEAITAIKAGDKATGQRLLTQYVQMNPHNEVAWLWLATAVTQPEQKQQCLQRVLEINPDNVIAKQGLVQLRAAETIDESPTLEDIVADVSSEKPGHYLKPLSSARPIRHSKPQSISIEPERSSSIAEVSPTNTDQNGEIFGLYLKVILWVGVLPTLLMVSIHFVAMFIARPIDISYIFNFMKILIPIALGVGALGSLLGLVMATDQVKSVRRMPSGNLKGAFNHNQMRETEIKLSYQEAFELCFEVAMAKGHIEQTDQSQGKIVVRTRMTRGFWSSSPGEIISFGLNPVDSGRTKVNISSKPVYFFTLLDKGRNLGNVEEIITYLKLKGQK